MKGALLWKLALVFRQVISYPDKFIWKTREISLYFSVVVHLKMYFSC